MQRRARIAWLGSVVAALACSGGGGSGGSGSNEAVITVTDAPLFVAELVEGIGLADGLGDVGDAPDTSAQIAVDAAALQLGASAVEAAVSIPPTTLDCGVSGSLEVSGDVASPDQPSAGDQITTKYTDCIEDPGDPELDGQLDITVRQFSGDFDEGDFAWSLDVVFGQGTDGDGFVRDFFLTPTSEPATQFSGRISLIQDTRQPNRLDVTLTGGPLTLTQNMQFQRFQTLQLLTSFNEQTGQYEIPPIVGLDANNQAILARGNLESSAFEGRVRFAVVQTLTGVGSDQPEDGEILITGANDATIRVLPDGDDVTLEIDADGDDATPPVVCEKTWSAVLTGTTCP